MGIVGPGPAEGIILGGGQLQITEQGIDPQGGNPQHGNFAEGIEAAEIHQDHIDHIGTAAAGHTVFQEEGADGGGVRGHHQQGGHRHPGADQPRQHHITAHPQGVGIRLGPRRQEIHGQHHQQHADHFHGQLGKRQIRRREAHKDQRHNQAHHTQADNRHHPLTVQHRGQQGSGDQHQSTKHRHPIHGQHGALPGNAVEFRQLPHQHRRHHRQHPGHIALQRAVLEVPGNRRGPSHQTLNCPFKDLLGIDFRQARIPGKQPPPAGVHGNTADHGNDTHQQGNIEPVPHRQVILRQGATQGSRGRHRQQPGHGDCRENPHRHTQGHQDFHRNLHVAGRLPGRELGQIHRLAIEEHVMNKARRIGHREHPAQGGAQRQQPAQGPQLIGLQGLGKEHFLGQEAVQ